MLLSHLGYNRVSDSGEFFLHNPDDVDDSYNKSGNYLACKHIMYLCVCRRLSGVVQDYIHGEVLPKIGRVAVIILSACAFGSLVYFNYTDIGFSRAVRLFYSQL